MPNQNTPREFKHGLGLLDSTMIVIGSMIGSGIFIVSADIARTVGSPVSSLSSVRSVTVNWPE
jgi:L-asparagine transporter-like permease